MAVTFRAAGAWKAGSTSLTSIAAPAGYAVGDVVFLFVAAKPYTAVITENSGYPWIEIASGTNGTVANGVDTGSVAYKLYYYVITADIWGSPYFGNGSVDVSGGNVALAVMHGYYNTTSGMGWDIRASSGIDTSSGTGFSCTMGSGLDIKAGDFLFTAAVIAGNNATFGSPTLAATGATLAALTESPATEGTTATGNDLEASAAYTNCTAGSSSSAPVAGWTLSAAQTGAAVVARIMATTPLPATTVTCVSNEGDPYAGDTEMLLHMEGNGSTVLSSTPNNTYDGYTDGELDFVTHKFARSSVRLGSAHYFRPSTSPYGTQPATIEFWFYCTANPPVGSSPSYTYNLLDLEHVGSHSYVRLSGADLSTGGVSFTGDGSRYGYTSCGGSAAMALNTWHHFAITFANIAPDPNYLTITLYVNGAAICSAVTYYMCTGTLFNDIRMRLVGNIDEFRSSGHLYYTGAFTPTTVPFQLRNRTVALTADDHIFLAANAVSVSNDGDQYISYVKRLFHMNVDGAVVIDAMSPTDVTCSTTGTAHTGFGKFGDTSIYTSGAYGSYIDAPFPTYLATQGTFCLEGWFYFETPATSTTRALFTGYGASSDDKFAVQAYVSTAASLDFTFYNINTNTGVSLGSINPITFDTWYHIAFVKSAGLYSLFVNGVPAALDVSWTNYAYNVYSVRIGGGSGFTAGHLGYIDEVRLTFGHRRYSAAFPIPDEFLTATTRTSFLGSYTALTDIEAAATCTAAFTATELRERAMLSTIYLTDQITRTVTEYGGFPYGSVTAVTLPSNNMSLLMGRTWYGDIYPTTPSYYIRTYVTLSPTWGMMWDTLPIALEYWRTVRYAGEYVYGLFDYGAASRAGTDYAWLYRTPDGTSWSGVAVPFAARWVDVAHGNDTLVAIATSVAGADTDRYAVSLDNGGSWTEYALPAVANWQTLVFFKGYFYVGGLSGAYRSTDGISWTAATGAGKVVAGERMFSTGSSTADGTTWDTMTQSIGWVAHKRGTYNDLYVASRSSLEYVLTSTDGVNWTAVTDPGGQWDGYDYGGVFYEVYDDAFYVSNKTGVYGTTPPISATGLRVVYDHITAGNTTAAARSTATATFAPRFFANATSESTFASTGGMNELGAKCELLPLLTTTSTAVAGALYSAVSLTNGTCVGRTSAGVIRCINSSGVEVSTDLPSWATNFGFIVSDGTMFFARRVSTSSISDDVWTSSNGVNWTLHYTAYSAPGYQPSIDYIVVSGNIVVAGGNPGGVDSRIAFSTDHGATWGTKYVTDTTGVSGVDVHGLCAANGMFFMLTYTTNTPSGWRMYTATEAEVATAGFKWPASSDTLSDVDGTLTVYYENGVYVFPELNLSSTDGNTFSQLGITQTNNEIDVWGRAGTALLARRRSTGALLTIDPLTNKPRLDSSIIVDESILKTPPVLISATKQFAYNESTLLRYLSVDPNGAFASGNIYPQTAAFVAAAKAVSTASGVMPPDRWLFGTLDGDSTASAHLYDTHALTGTLACEATATGALPTPHPLDAAVSSVSSVTAALTINPGLYTASYGRAKFYPVDLTTHPSARLEVAAQARSVTGVSLTTRQPIASSRTAEATTTAALSTQIRLIAGVDAVSTSAAAITTAIRPAAPVAVVATVSGSLVTEIRLAASVSDTVATTAALTTAIRPVSSAHCTAASTAALTTQIRLASSVVCTGSYSAALTTRIQCRSSVGAVPAVTAGLTTGIRLNSTPESLATSSAWLKAGAGLRADYLSLATATGRLEVVAHRAGKVSVKLRTSRVDTKATSGRVVSRPPCL